MISSATSLSLLNMGNLDPLAVVIPDAPGPPAKYTIGVAGFGFVLFSRTKLIDRAVSFTPLTLPSSSYL